MKSKLTRRLTTAVLPAFALGLCGVTMADGDDDDRRKFKADLDGFQEVPAVLTRGEGELRLKRRHGSLRYELSYEDLEGSIVRFAHIHFGRPGTNGGVIVFLCNNAAPNAPAGTPACPPPTGGTVEGVLTADAVVGPAGQGIDPGEFRGLMRALRNKAAYVNVHSDTFPAGEIRGDIDD